MQGNVVSLGHTAQLNLELVSHILEDHGLCQKGRVSSMERREVLKE